MTSSANSTDKTTQAECFDDMLNEIRTMSPNGRHALDETITAIGDLAKAGVDPLLRRVVHRVFERSVAEFFTDEPAASMQMPPELVSYTVPNPRGIALPQSEEVPLATLAEVLGARRSRRAYANTPMSLGEISTILQMAAKSNSTEDGYGTRNVPQMPYPNIGGLDPVEIGIVALAVDGLEPGYYVYDKVGHTCVPEIRGNMRLALLNATFENDWMFYAPVVFVLSVNMKKIAWKYKTRGYRISHIDLGAALQNIHLACTAYDLACCAVAGYHDEAVNRLFHHPIGDQAVGVLVPIGHRANTPGSNQR